MKINGRITHFGETPRSGGTQRTAAPIAARPSVEPDTEVVWYPHRDAPSLLQPDLMSPHANHLQSRGAITLRSKFQSSPAWSWQG